MKIALITPFKDSFGGVETVSNLLAQIFRDEGWSVDIITSDEFETTLVDKLLKSMIGLPYITAKRFRTTDTKYDVVICNGEYGYGIRHPKAINLFHGCYKGLRDYLRENITLKQYLALTKAMAIQRTSSRHKYVVTVSEFIKEILESDNILVDKVIVNCVNSSLFKPDPRVKKNERLLFVGSWNYYAKGFDILEQLVDKGYQVDCVTDKPPGGNLGWIQNIPRDKMPEIYNQYRLFIFPSRFEGAGMAPLEAMACGLPIVMRNVGLGVEIGKEIPGFIVSGDGEDVDMFVIKLQHIERRYKYYSDKAREYAVVNHDIEVYRRAWINLVEEIHAMES